MKVKYLLAFSAACIFISLSMLNCRKEKSASPVTSQQVDLNTVAQKTEAWLRAQQAHFSQARRASIDTLLENVIWNSERKMAATAQKSLGIFMLRESYKTVNITTKTTQKFLVVVFDNADSIQKGNIVELIPREVNASDPFKAIVDIYADGPNDYDGIFSILSITNRFGYEMEFKMGKLYSQRFPEAKSFHQSGKTAGCTDWYWEYYINGVLFYEQYAYTTCDGGETETECRSFRNIDKDNSFKSSCGGGSGGGEVVIVTVDTVVNQLTNPCLVSILNGITSTNLKNQIIKLYQQTYIGSGNGVRLKIIEVSSLNDQNGVPQIAQSWLLPAQQEWGIKINTSFVGSSSKEYITIGILHELVHSFVELYQNTTNSPLSEFDNHKIIFQRWVNQLRDALIEICGISSSDATSLALQGMDDVLLEGVDANNQYIFQFQYDQFAQQNYGTSLNAAKTTSDQYRTGAKGTVTCP